MNKQNLTTKEFIHKLQNPQVFTGRELNAVHKTPGENDLSICLVFPDTYEIGMSHYGLKILYHQLNAMENMVAERCFLPAKASIHTFKKYDFPLFSLESKRPLKEFELIGFSLLSEMTYTNVLQVLDLAQIPLRREQRDGDGRYPLIAAGGISVVNPEPLRDFIDIFAVGDGEVLFPEIISALDKIKREKLTGPDALECFDAVDGLYVPALAPLEKKGRFYVPRVKSGGKRKQVTHSLKEAIPGYKIIAPITNVVFNRLTVEVARGCPQNCRFCQAKSYYSPYRAQSLEDAAANIREGLAHTGFDAFSLSSLSSGDYPCIEPLLQLIPQYITNGTSFSLPSLRPSTLSENLLSTLALFRRTGITIVPEAGTERLRRVINKNVTDTEIFDAVEMALKHNWQKIKLYFMIGLPTETMKDIDGIISLIREIQKKAAAGGKKINIHASFSSFVPKPHTPFQWAGRENLTSLLKKIDYLKKNLHRTKRLDIDVHLPHKGVVETILARGDYRAGDLLQKAFEAGEIFSAWDSDFHYQQWREWIDGSPFEVFLDAMNPDETLPWDFLQVNFNPDYLLREHRKAEAGEETPSCSEMNCKDCSGCFYPFKRDMAMKPPETQDTAPTETKDTEQEKPGYNQVRIFYEKTGDFTFFSHLSMVKYVERLIRKAGIGFKCTEGFHPRIKMVALPPLPVFAVGREEVVEIFADDRLDQDEMLERLRAVSEDLEFKKVRIVKHSRVLSRDIRFLSFEINVPGLRADEEKVSTLEKLAADTDEISWSGDTLVLSMDYAAGGQERFAKIYKVIDPEKSQTAHLTRTGVTFKPPLATKGLF